MSDKPKYNPEKHHRRSIRLKDYDYSQVGAYFVTICIKDKECLLGKIEDNVMYLNEAGSMIDKWWQKIPEKFSDIELGEYQIMPNHFHAIVINVGADPCVRPPADIHVGNSISLSGEVDERIDSQANPNDTNSPEGELGEHVGSPLHTVVQWFKTMATNEYIRNVKQNNWPVFNGKLWQRNYYEHIIRNQKSHQSIAKYIYENPANWEKDKLFVR